MAFSRWFKMNKDKIEVVETKISEENREYLKENSPAAFNRKLLNPINVIRLQRMIFKLPPEDRLKCLPPNDPKKVKFEEFSKEGQKIYTNTINKIMGIKKK